jgi:O-phosphoseryl-tRNA(Cys) synthetase
MNHDAKTYSLDERLKIVKNMKTYGGSFAWAIAEALLVADSDNVRRIEEAFPELLEKYAAEHWK